MTTLALIASLYSAWCWQNTFGASTSLARCTNNTPHWPAHVTRTHGRKR